MSSGGNDSILCGNDESTACQTFDYLLERFQNTTRQRKLDLQLITDKNILIDERSKVSHFYN